MPKEKVYFKEFNAVEYVGHHMIVTQTDDEAGNEQLERWMSMAHHEVTKQTQMWLMGK